MSRNIMSQTGHNLAKKKLKIKYCKTEYDIPESKFKNRRQLVAMMTIKTASLGN